MKSSKITLAAAATATLAVAAHAQADYVANFDTTGSVTDFAEFQGQSADGIATLDGSAGDQFLRLTVTRDEEQSVGGQLQYAVAPLNATDPGVALPTGMLGDAAGRTEARLAVRFEGNTPASESGVLPFTSFGFADYDSSTNTANYLDKLIVQLNANNVDIALGESLDSTNPFSPTASFAANPMPGDLFELQVTENQFRLLQNGNALTSEQTDEDGFVGIDLGEDVTLADFDGDQLIPFLGIIRGGILPLGDTLTAGFDDISAMSIDIPGSRLAGDANGDGSVTIADFAILRANFGTSNSSFAMGDFNEDGDVTIADFAILRANFGTTTTAAQLAEADAWAASVVPEPATLGLLAAAGLGLVRRRV